MNIHHTNNFPQEVIWETQPTDVVPFNVEKIGLTYTGDVYVQTPEHIYTSRNHFTDETPAVVTQTYKGNKSQVNGHIGQALGNIGETQVRDVLLRTTGLNPDNLLYPLLVKTPQGHKELSDGIILHGNHAFILQVKTTVPSKTDENIEWYRQKIRNSRRLAIKQALTSHEMLKEHKRLTFQTYSGKTKIVNVQDYTWSYVNVLAFSSLPVAKPARFVLPASSHHLPTATLSLKEWKDMFTYLPYSQAIHLLKKLCYMEDPEFFGFNLFNLIQGESLGIYSRTSSNVFVEALEQLLTSQPLTKKFITLRKKLDTLSVEQLAMLSQGYVHWQGKTMTKLVTVAPHVKIAFSSPNPGVEYVNRGVVLHF